MISDIRLQHFRSYDDAFFELDPSVNIIVGPNASGKTNLLEAVLIAAHGGSYRAKDTELVQFGADWARLDAHTPTEHRIVKLQTLPAFSKTFEFDGKQLTRLAQVRTLPTVLFEPDHLLLMGGSPDLRRSFLDDLIEQIVPGYSATRKHYRRVLSQRNSLLKKNPPNLTQQLFVWNVRLSELGGQMAKQRFALVERFSARISELYSSLAGHASHIELVYATRFSQSGYESQLLHKLEHSTDMDVLRGFTAYGPHRDDLVATIDGHPFQEAASRGETRTLVLALKILELQLLEEIRGTKPLLLLDDVFSELDQQRRSALTGYVYSYQTFITTTDADVAANQFAGSAIIPLSG